MPPILPDPWDDITSPVLNAAQRAKRAAQNILFKPEVNPVKFKPGTNPVKFKPEADVRFKPDVKSTAPAPSSGSFAKPKPTVKGQNFLTNRLGAIRNNPLVRGAGQLLGRGFGGYELITGQDLPTRIIGGATVVNPGLGLALTAGRGIGEWAQSNLPESDAVSGRGSGSAALSGKKQRTKDRVAISKTVDALRPKNVVPVPVDTSAPETETPPTAPPSTDDPAKIYLHPDLKGPKGNEVGSDSDPLEPGRQGPGDPPGPPGAVRVNENNVVQVGRSLSGANAALEGLGLAPLQDAARFFEGYKPQVSTGAESIGKGTSITPTSDGDTGMSKEGAEAIGKGTLITPTSAGATGQDASDPQAGISGAADAGEAKRTIADATSGIGPDPRFSKGAIRRASVRAFLDAPAGSGYNAIRARDAAAGISRIPGQEGVLINGEFRQFADGVDAKQMRQAAYAATGDGFATKDSQKEWTDLFLKRAEEAKGDTPTAENPAAPATPAEATRPGTPLKPVVIPQEVIDRARGMEFDPSNPTKQDPEYARLRDASIRQFLDSRTTKDVFDTATQTWKQVPINR